jgi:exopolysaccharide production protein ExoF
MKKLLFVICLVLPFLMLAQACRAEYLLGPDDNLTVRVYEWPDLNGDFKVAPDGKISFPLIGDVAATGLTTSQLEKAVGAMLTEQARLKVSPSITVQIREFRPFFIIGDVQKPGAYPFHPGLTVLQAVSVAGGFFRFTDPGLLRFERDAIIHGGELLILKDKLLNLTVRNARLEAERTGAADMSYPDGDALDPKNPRIALLMERENLLFRTRRNDLTRQLAGLDDLQKLYRGEIAALQSQIESEKQQAVLVQKELDELRGLAARGLAANPRLLLVERTIAEIEGTQRNLEANIMRARQSIAQAGQQADEAKVKFRERVDTESEAVASEMRETRARVETTSQLVTEAEETAPVASARRLRNAGAEPKYKVSRHTSGNTTEDLEVGSHDQIEPGDVIQVDRSLPDPLETGPRQSKFQTGQAELPYRADLDRQEVFGTQTAIDLAPFRLDGRASGPIQSRSRPTALRKQ